ncbi:RHS repeat-associated core domain-containing protein [Dyella mobilis]|uniref:Teneurin-like YD-shell domain-containing protein n=1 Tax=Dyella mobilis TaxID=1849582 RepID=A0ABS2KE75_9GAMM|nr:RHS repeat-associated core domain-containing protein [Dyella mobilis]MBM7129471.1 hypothetical protein [Dyella mobilis]GLQ98265.1 hypothetical protein GCM10007863_26850 [Dyella mobilis]
MHARHSLLRCAFVNALLLVGLTTIAHARDADLDAQRYGVFAEPLIAANPPSSNEQLALMRAIAAYRQAGDAGDTAALQTFLAAHPDNPWRASLWLDIGLADRTAGRFGAAIHAFELARITAQATPMAAMHPIAVRALSEQLTLEARLGHESAVTNLLQAAQHLGMSVQDSMAMSMAEENVWDMQHHPQSAFQCGWIALRALWQTQGIRVDAKPALQVDASHRGYSLDQLVTMADTVHHPVAAIHQDEHAAIPVPSVVHWKSGHFATILAHEQGRYRVADPTVEGGSLWMTEAAVRAESSGYFLVPATDRVLAMNERSVSRNEAATVRGAGYTTANDPHGFPGGCNQTCTGSDGPSGGVNGAGGNTGGNTPGAAGAPAPTPSTGMPSYSISPMLISLSLRDTPLSYSPPKGSAINITFSYNQLDIDQPATFTFGNVGPLWTHNWLSYVQDNPTSPGTNVMVYLPGGPGRLYSGYNSANGTFSPETETGAQLVEVSTSPVVYQRRFADGSMDVYAASDNSSYYPRHVFLTQRIDAHGNAVQLAYDGQNRLATLTDALGQVVTFHYDNTSFPLQVTSVSDAFGRSATLGYNGTGQLSSITDAIGMMSSFTYASGTSSITASTTPYGTTSFATGQSGLQRWINITDPDGNVSRMEFNEGVAGVPYSESQVPQGMATFNAYINDRDTFYWDAQAYKLDAGNYADAVIYHWAHLAINGQFVSTPYTTSDALESIKYPLENRIWYSHPGDIAGGSGALNVPTNIGRVLSNGSTQLTQNSYDSYGHLLSTIDPSGLTTTYTYAGNQIDVVAITRSNSSGYHTSESFAYDNLHDVVSHVDQTGATTSYTYNAAGQLLTSADALGHEATYSYNAQGYLQSSTDANGGVSTYTYDPVGRLASVTDTMNRTTHYGYDALNRPIQTTYPDGSSVLINWNKLDIGAITDRNGHTTRFLYDGVRDLITRTDPLGIATNYTYYPNRLLATRIDANGHTTSWQRDLEGRVTSVTDALGHVSSVAYDPSTDVRASSTNAMGQVTQYTYDVFDRLVASTDPNGIITNFTYTPQSWLASRIVRANTSGSPSSGDATTTYAYDAIGDVTTVTDPDGVATNYAYDPDHRRITVTDALGNTQNSSYDNVGNRTQVTATASGSTTPSWQQSMVYDVDNEPGVQVDAYGNTTNRIFDVNGRLQDTRDPLGHHTTNTYDAIGNLLAVAQGASDSGQPVATTSYTYDQDSHLLTVSDPSLLVTSYTYDPVGQLVQRKSPDTGVTSHTYDAVGNVLTSTDAKGITATSTYDPLNRLLTTSYPDTTQNIIYSYDDSNSMTGCTVSYPIGRLTRIIENSVTTVYCYDQRGNVIQKQQTVGGTKDTTLYAVSPGGRVGVITYPSGTVVNYVRDGDGRIQGVNVTQTGGATTMAVGGVVYQPFGPVRAYALGNGQQVVRNYDENYRLTDLTSPAFNLHVARDAVGDIAAVGNAPGANPATETYSYDPLYRLTAATEANGSTLESVTYNATGDRLSKAGSGLATGTYSYNTGTHQLIATGNAARAVDADGNTTAIYEAGNTYGFGYSDRNRMVVAQLAGSTVGAYTYNALSQRIQKVAGSQTERYDYNETGQLLAEYGATIRDYVWMDDIPVAEVDTGASGSGPSHYKNCTIGPNNTLLCQVPGENLGINYIVADQMGTPRAVSDSGGNLEWQNAYQGNPWNEKTPTSLNGYILNLGFPGQYYDLETGLNYNVHRDYDSSTGRYIESDPLGLRAGPSTYAYVGGNPLGGVDPSGQIVKVVASDPQTAQVLMNAYAYLNQNSSTARDMDTDLENSATVYKIEPTDNKDNDEYCSPSYEGCPDNDHIIYVDICDLPLVPTTDGMQPVPLPVLLGHELGHAWAYGPDNPTANDPLGDDVRQVENPIRSDLGLPLRTSYYPPAGGQ